MSKEQIGQFLLVFVSLIMVIVVLMQSPISQDISYHHFHDERNILGISNFWNVISNVLFVFVGVKGLAWCINDRYSCRLMELKQAYFILFIGITCVGLGSAYYHLEPNNSTLVWDRLPMTITFMSLFSIIVGEYISVKVGKWLLYPLLIVGGFSVLYWYYTEQQGHGDLRLYILVQFLPMLLMPIILLAFSSVFTHRRAYWLMMGAYFIAKLFEHFDEELAEIIGFSGHSLKHIAAGVGLLLLANAYNSRKRADLAIKK